MSIQLLSVLLLVAVCVSECREVHIRLLDNITQLCPGTHSDLVDRKSIGFRLSLVDRHEGLAKSSADRLVLTEQNGRVRQLSFPACYRVELSFRTTKPVHDPYVEAFLQLGTNVQCEAESAHFTPDKSDTTAQLCANVTKSADWCPRSELAPLRKMLNGKQTCRFCNLCEQAAKSNDVKKYISGGDNKRKSKCESETTSGLHTLNFKMCTPESTDMSEHEQRLNEYWSYLKQGVLAAVIHVADRRTPESMSRCGQLCLARRRAPQGQRRQTLETTIGEQCAPQDSYLACIYHTLKFSMDGDFH